MKLFEVPNKTRVKLQSGEEIFFDHIDGMFSYCVTDEQKVVHLASWVEVEIVEDKDILK